MLLNSGEEKRSTAQQSRTEKKAKKKRQGLWYGRDYRSFNTTKETRPAELSRIKASEGQRREENEDTAPG